MASGIHRREKLGLPLELSSSHRLQQYNQPMQRQEFRGRRESMRAKQIAQMIGPITPSIPCLDCEHAPNGLEGAAPQ